jgi:anthranilate synthase component I
VTGLHQPAPEAFRELAADHPIVPVWREVLADLLTPLGVYDRLRDAEGPTFLLESVEHGERWGRYSFIGMDPLLTLTARDGAVRLEGPGTAALPEVARSAADSGDPLATLDAVTTALRTPQLEGLPPLFAGMVGYVGYDVVRFVERIPATGLDDLGTDDVRLVLPGTLVAFDHLRQRLAIISNVLVGDDPDAARAEALRRADALVVRLATPPSAPPAAPPRAVRVTDAEANMAPEDYERAVERAKEHIAAGDCFQVVPSQRFSLATDVDPFAVYRVLRVINPSPYMYLFDWGDLQVVGSSPEALVTLRGGIAQIWPIAGSRPRAAEESEDAALEADLRADEKERAEHVMLVDLARNDLGRVCELGTVQVAELMNVVRYSHVMHLESRVEGRVREGVTPVDVLRATFPAGTLTGAPKVRAMEVIDDLEPTRRGVYGGGIGYLDLAGNMDLCIAIRTLVLTGGRAHVQAGAGVVADSVPQRELEETRNKAMALLAAVRAAEALEAQGPTPAEVTAGRAPGADAAAGTAPREVPA